jgi:hypothetical protein
MLKCLNMLQKLWILKRQRAILPPDTVGAAVSPHHCSRILRKLYMWELGTAS